MIHFKLKNGIINKTTLAVLFLFLVSSVVGCNKASEVSFPKYDLNLTNAPASISSKTDLNIMVQGFAVNSYKYKVGPAATTDCNTSTGYSPTTLTTAPIADNLSSYPDQKMVLCVLAIDSQGAQSLYQDAKKVEWYLDRVPATVNVTQYEQTVSESNTATQILTVTIDSPKPYPVNVTYDITGNATYMMDHNLPTSGVITIPANANSTQVTFQVLHNTGRTISSQFLFRLLESDVPSLISTGAQYNSSFYVKDIDGGIKPSISSLVMDGFTTCVLDNNGSIKCWGRNDYGQVGSLSAAKMQTTAVAVDPGVSYLKLTGGSFTFCGITTSNVLKCWGRNANGQLGLGNNADMSVPMVVDAGVSYAQVVTNSSSTCAITTAGVLKCWGANSSGTLGNNSTTDRNLPTVIDTGVTYSQIITAGSTTCGRTTGNILKCWGANSTGSVGNSSTANRLTPFTVDGGTLYSQFTTGTGTTCGITTANVLKCWGYNNSGQVGDNTSVNKTAPVIIDSGVTYSSIKTNGGGTCGITSANILKCWGVNTYGQVGNNSTTNALLPVVVDSGTLYASTTIHNNSKCAITTLGVLKCWGINSSREVGDGTISSRRATPVTIDVGVNYASALTVNGTTCGITMSGEIKCWGVNYYGAIGDGTKSAVYEPTLIDNDNYTSFSASTGTVCAVATSGDLKCWGSNSTFSVGDGTNVQRKSPKIIDPGVAYKSVVANLTSCGITIEGVLKCWGNNTSGTVGDGTFVNKELPTIVDAGTKYKSVTIGDNTVCGITEGQILKCWGVNPNGGVGDGTTTNRSTPYVVDGGTKFSAVTISYGTTCALTADDGTLKCWGANFTGAVGNNSVSPSVLSPVVIDSGTKYKMIKTNQQTTCGITTARVLKCWGYNHLGQVGNNGAVSIISPAVIDAGIMYDYVNVGAYTTCAVTYPGQTLKCWGYNGAGQVGDGSTAIRTLPVTIDSGSTYQFASVVYNSCGITATNLLKCWGENMYGQAGNGTAMNAYTPALTLDAGTTYSNLITHSNGVCALTTSGKIKCWGRNDSSATGTGADYFRNLPRSIMTWVSP